MIDNRPEIVCLCGSTRFADAYRLAMRDQTLAGRIVLTVGLLGHQEGLDMSGPVKAMLDRLHLAKIDLANSILVLNVDGYIGHSTRNEIAHAVATGKVVRYLEPIQRVDTDEEEIAARDTKPFTGGRGPAAQGGGGGA